MIVNNPRVVQNPLRDFQKLSWCSTDTNNNDTIVIIRHFFEFGTPTFVIVVTVVVLLFCFLKERIPVRQLFPEILLSLVFHMVLKQSKRLETETKPSSVRIKNICSFFGYHRERRPNTSRLKRKQIMVLNKLSVPIHTFFSNLCHSTVYLPLIFLPNKYSRHTRSGNYRHSGHISPSIPVGSTCSVATRNNVRRVDMKGHSRI